MSQAANVSAIEAIREFKAGLCEFSEQAGAALHEAQADVQRVLSWLQHDQPSHWQRELRKRSEKMAQAKSELYRAELASREERPSCVVERRNFEKAKALVEEAEQKLARAKFWSRTLEREMTLYKGHAQQLARTVEGEVPVVLAKMDRMVESLEAYVSMSAPPSARHAANATSSSSPAAAGEEAAS